MKVLFISNLFPDAAEPNRGSYNATLLKFLAQLCEVRVLSPRPSLWPFRSAKKISPRAEDQIFAPVYPPAKYIPKIGSRWNHRLMARSIRDSMEKIRKEFSFDVLLSSWVYPDGCATAELAREFNVPFVAVAQGSDVHQYLQMPARRKIISSALNRSSGVIARSRELSRLLADVGVDEKKIRVVYNGIDSELFHPADQRAARQELGLPQSASIILFVGNLLPIKNPSLLVAAHAELCRRQPSREFHLVIIGTGPLAPKLRSEADASGFGKKVFLVGRKSPGEVARYMQAANVLCVCSNNEGVPNVILESFACGLRVVATEVGGIPEVLPHDFLGRLVGKKNGPALAAALGETLAETPQSEKIFQHATGFSWKKTARAYFEILDQARQGWPGK